MLSNRHFLVAAIVISCINFINVASAWCGSDYYASQKITYSCGTDYACMAGFVDDAATYCFGKANDQNVDIYFYGHSPVVPNFTAPVSTTANVDGACDDLISNKIPAGGTTAGYQAICASAYAALLNTQFVVPTAAIPPATTPTTTPAPAAQTKDDCFAIAKQTISNLSANKQGNSCTSGNRKGDCSSNVKQVCNNHKPKGQIVTFTTCSVTNYTDMAISCAYSIPR